MRMIAGPAGMEQCSSHAMGSAAGAARSTNECQVKNSTTPRILFLGCTYAGHKTRFHNLQANVHDDSRMCPTFRAVSGWIEGGRIERLPLLSNGLKSRTRAVFETRGMATFPRPDAIWTSTVETALPYLWSQVGPVRRPLALDLDCTTKQLEERAPIYFGRPPKRGGRALVAQLIERALWQRTTLFLPWSHWAANALRQEGIPSDRIRVLPPGTDLDRWRPSTPTPEHGGDPLRLLFVGGDFVRKGGDMLVDVFRRRLMGRCELDIVTRDVVPSVPGVRVHRAEANSPTLRDLYARADLFVLPTRAECYGIATTEAMASGIPVIMGDVGAAKEIVDHGETGWLVTPTTDALAEAIDHAVMHRHSLPAMGRRARQVAEERFDGRRNDRELVDMLLALAKQRESR